jgi:hypothetical protein
LSHCVTGDHNLSPILQIIYRREFNLSYNARLPVLSMLRDGNIT